MIEPFLSRQPQGHWWPHLKQGASIVSIMAAFLTSSASSDRSSVHCSCRSAVLVAVNQSHGRGVGVNAYLSITINHDMPPTLRLALVTLLQPPMGPLCSQDNSSGGIYDHWLVALARTNSNLAHTRGGESPSLELRGDSVVTERVDLIDISLM